MEVASALQEPAGTMVAVPQPTITTSMVAALVRLQHVQTMAAATVPTITISMVVAQAVQQLVPTMVAVTQPTTITSMVAAQVAQQLVPTTMEAIPPTITTSMAVVSDSPLLVQTMAVVRLQHITILTVAASVPVTIGNSYQRRQKKMFIVLFKGLVVDGRRIFLRSSFDERIL